MSAPSAHSWTEETTEIESRGKLRSMGFNAVVFQYLQKFTIPKSSGISAVSLHTDSGFAFTSYFNHCHKM